MLTIRLHRTGKKNQPFFRIIVNDKRRSAQSGYSLENLGFYNPLTKEKVIKAERVKYWLEQGAKVSDTVHNLLVNEGILKKEKISVHNVSKKEEDTSEKKEIGETKVSPKKDESQSDKIEKKEVKKTEEKEKTEEKK